MRTSTSILALLALLLAFNLAACGNKGPLVRPSADEIEDVQDVEETEASSADEAEADPDDEGAVEDVPAGDVPVEDADEGGGVDTPPPAEPGHG